MKIDVISGDITTQKTETIVVNLFEGVVTPSGVTGAVDQNLGGAISTLIKDGEITGKKNEMTLIHTLRKMVPSRVLVAGLGKQSEMHTDTIRKVSAASLRYLCQLGISQVATIAHGAGTGKIDPELSGKAISEGSILGLYKFDKYKSNDKNSLGIKRLTIVENDPTKVSELEAGVSQGVIVADATNLCRDMANEPANFMTPTKMSEIALEVSKESNLEITILSQTQIAEFGMGAFLGVAQGSEEPPKFIVVRYKGDPGNPRNNLGLVGKGITFDTGGISLKPAGNMGAMKGDMAGGAAVICAMKAIGKLSPKINVTGIVAATENMPGGKAQRPGDIVKAMNGKTIEIDNTDAEGRLILADAISYASSIGLNQIVDVATLTSAIVVSLGKVCTGAFGNNDALMTEVLHAGNQVGERSWQMPMFDDYKIQFKSDIADLKNTGGRAAGSITAAQFIGEFAEGTKWVHLDIAGTSRTDKIHGYNIEGATGVPVRTLIQLTLNLAKT